MSSSHLTKLRNFSGCWNYLSRKYFVNTHFYRRNHLKMGGLSKQQVNVNVLSNMYRSTHTGNAKLGVVNVSADYDPDLHEFNNAYELIRKAMCHTDDESLADAVNWSAKVLDYNVQDGKKNRGVTVLKAFKVLVEEEIPADKMLQACVLGWCMELLQGFFVMCDDIMDNSTIRRGKPCWYKMPEVGLIAINDSLLLQFGIYKILKIYFERGEIYNNILHEFLEATHNTVYGQCLDMLNVPPNAKSKFENFNLKKYHAIVQYKTSYYTFCLPVHLAMHLVGNFSEKEFEETKNICMKLGLLFQIQFNHLYNSTNEGEAISNNGEAIQEEMQVPRSVLDKRRLEVCEVEGRSSNISSNDDYLDIFGDPNITGKIGTDIIDGKCTWFSAYFFEHAPESLKKVMMENYGVNSKDAVSEVMKMYKELKLEEKYYECEESFRREITSMINNLSRNSLQELFLKLLKKLYQRKK